MEEKESIEKMKKVLQDESIPVKVTMEDGAFADMSPRDSWNCGYREGYAQRKIEEE